VNIFLALALSIALMKSSETATPKSLQNQKISLTASGLIDNIVPEYLHCKESGRFESF
jgi:hypothetical protein